MSNDAYLAVAGADRFRKSKSSALLAARGGCGCCTLGDAALDARPEWVPPADDEDAEDAGAEVNEAKRKSSSFDDMGGRACGDVAADEDFDEGLTAEAEAEADAEGLETDRPPKSRMSSC